MKKSIIVFILISLILGCRKAADSRLPGSEKPPQEYLNGGPPSYFNSAEKEIISGKPIDYNIVNFKSNSIYSFFLDLNKQKLEKSRFYRYINNDTNRDLYVVLAGDILFPFEYALNDEYIAVYGLSSNNLQIFKLSTDFNLEKKPLFDIKSEAFAVRQSAEYNFTTDRKFQFFSTGSISMSVYNGLLVVFSFVPENPVYHLEQYPLTDNEREAALKEYGIPKALIMPGENRLKREYNFISFLDFASGKILETVNLKDCVLLNNLITLPIHGFHDVMQIDENITLISCGNAVYLYNRKEKSLDLAQGENYILSANFYNDKIYYLIKTGDGELSVRSVSKDDLYEGNTTLEMVLEFNSEGPYGFEESAILGDSLYLFDNQTGKLFIIPLDYNMRYLLK